MHHLRTTFFLTLALSTAAACTAILKPKDDAERCGTPQDCSPTGDNRYVPLCVFDEEATGIDSTKVEKICVASYKNIACGPGASVEADELCDAGAGSCGTYPPCDTSDVLGCEQVSGCTQGDVNQYGVCDDGSGAHPMVGSSWINNSANDLDCPDIYDQICRGYFCDDSFVCFQGTCQPCDPDPEATYGEGGCGEVHRKGALSPIYESASWSDEGCADASASDIVFGMCPPP